MNASPVAATPAAYPRLLFLEIEGGYLDGLRVAFAPHTTCIIGGKGSGKTTLFELLRFVFAAASLAAKSSVHSLLKKNLGAGVVRVGYETKHGVRCLVERRLADERPRFFTAEGEPLKLDAKAVTVEAYGQDEIERVGEDRTSQRGLVDRLAGEELRLLAAEIAQVVTRMGEGATTLLALEAEIAALESSAAEARAIEEQLKPLLVGTGADAALLTQAHGAKGLRAREKQAAQTAGAALADVRVGAEAFAASVKKKLVAVIPAEARTGANAALLAELESHLAAVGGAVEDLVAVVARRAEAAGVGATGVRERLAEAHAEQDKEYDALLERQKEDQAQIDERARLQERLSVVAGAVPLLEERGKLHAQLRAEQDKLADRLVELRDLRSAVRTRLEERYRARLEADGVRIRIDVDQQQDEYRSLLREVLAPVTGGQPKWLVDKIAPSVRPDELVAMVRAQDKARLVERAGLGKHVERAAQALAALTPNAHLYALQAVTIDDEVVIETLHGKVWKDTVQCSPGQRSGAILPLLLLEGDTPLLIDQPDDNVDPDYMCSAILPRIAALRGARQFVFVTHHANVPVLSGADQVVLIESDGLSAGLRAEGGILPMKDWLVSKLEGGESAFEKRKATYARAGAGARAD